MFEKPHLSLPRVMNDEIRSVRRIMPDMSYVVSIFKLMADETRVSILWLLSKGQWCVHDLAVVLETSPSNISHHLRLLRAFRLVKGRKEGQKVYYGLDDDHVVKLLEEAFEHAGHE